MVPWNYERGVRPRPGGSLEIKSRKRPTFEVGDSTYLVVSTLLTAGFQRLREAWTVPSTVVAAPISSLTVSCYLPAFVIFCVSLYWSWLSELCTCWV